MNQDSKIASPQTPILVVPYMWIGDFVRCHTVVSLLRVRFPERAIDLLASPVCAPLCDYMPGVRAAVAADLPRRRLAFAEHAKLARRLAHERYGTALIMSRKWKAALAPFLAGIPERTGFVGEMRFRLVNDLRFGERKLARMIDQCATLALPAGASLPAELPPPKLDVPAAEAAAWRGRNGLDSQSRPAIALAPGAVGPSKRWPAAAYGALARRLLAEGCAVWIVGGPDEKELARRIVGDTAARDLTGPDLRDAVMALASATVAISNDSGLLHVAAAIGTPSIGIFGPTGPSLWAPLNPLAATIQSPNELDCRPCHKPQCRLGHHRCMVGIEAETVIAATRRALAATAAFGPQDRP